MEDRRMRRLSRAGTVFAMVRPARFAGLVFQSGPPLPRGFFFSSKKLKTAAARRTTLKALNQNQTSPWRDSRDFGRGARTGVR